MRKSGLLVLLLLLSAFYLFAEPEDIESKYNEIKDDINVFYSESCSHCHDLLEFLMLVENKNKDLRINYFEIKKTGNEDNYELLSLFCSEYDTQTNGVPRMFINGTPYVGFSEGNCSEEFIDGYKAYVVCRNEIQSEFLKWAEEHGIEYNFLAEENDLSSIPLFIIGVILLLYGVSYFIFRNKLKERKFKLWLSGLFILFIVFVFSLIFFIPENLITSFAKKLPFPLFVIVIALADGFNPCAFAVLFIILSLLTHAEKKRDMNLMGSIFIITSAVMYFIFIIIIILTGTFFINMYGNIIMRILGAVITVVGLINIKDFVFFKKGISMSVSDEQKTDISKKAAGIVKYLKTGSVFGFVSAIAATILLGITVNIIELGCSAILPVVYMTALVNQFGVEIGFPHIVWTVNYAVIYVVPMIVVLFWFIFTYKSSRLSESKGKLLKLAGGLIMILGGLILIIKPGALFFR